MTNLVYSKTLVAGSPENVNDLNSNLNDIKNVINGGISNANLTGTAAITDANLASPNNAAYRKISQTSSVFADNLTAATFIFVDGGFSASGSSIAGNMAGTGVIYLAAADYAVAGLTSKLRIRAQCLVNATAPAVTFTVGLYEISSVAGGADVFTPTLGTVIAGSTVAFASPGLSTRNQGNSGDFTLPADSYYAFGLASSGTPTADTRGMLSVQLQYRNV